MADFVAEVFCPSECVRLIQDQASMRNPFAPIRLLRIFILQLLRGDFCNKIGTSRHFAVVPNDGRDRSEADMPRASGACRSGENDPFLPCSTRNFCDAMALRPMTAAVDFGVTASRRFASR